MPARSELQRTRAEQLAYWFFRLNGCTTIPNFIVHPDSGSNQGTDVDIIAVRFPHRAENQLRPMKDHESVSTQDGRIRIMLAEVKTGLCDFNGPWSNPERENMHRVMRALGALQDDLIVEAAKSLYHSGIYKDSQFHISLYCIGARKNEMIAEKKPEVPQILWPNVALFIYDRFRKYRTQKASNDNWGEIGKWLWELTKVRPVEKYQGMIFSWLDGSLSHEESV